jgi:hypothetical protein
MMSAVRFSFPTPMVDPEGSHKSARAGLKIHIVQTGEI